MLYENFSFSYNVFSSVSKVFINIKVFRSDIFRLKYINRRQICKCLLNHCYIIVNWCKYINDAISFERITYCNIMHFNKNLYWTHIANSSEHIFAGALHWTYHTLSLNRDIWHYITIWPAALNWMTI